MIQIRVRNQNDKTEMVIQGHAGYHPGNDIVCAAVSALVNTLAQRVLQDFEAAKIESKFIKLKSGDSRVAYIGRDPILHQITATILDGLKGIENSYPQHLKIFISSEKAGH